MSFYQGLFVFHEVVLHTGRCESVEEVRRFVSDLRVEVCSGKEDVKGWFGNNWLRFATKLTGKRPNLVSGVVVIAGLGINAVGWREILKGDGGWQWKV